MPKTPVNPPSLVKPIGYSHAFAVTGGRMLFMAGQVAFDKDGRVVGKDDIVAQFRQILENLKILVSTQGGSLHNIVKLTIYVLDKANYKAHSKEIGQVYREYFGKHYPAMTLVEVKGLYDADAGCMIEIEGIAAFD